MKQIKVICILLAAIYAMASCVKDSDETILYDEAAITAFSLVTVNKYTVKDTTTTKTTYSGSTFKFVIDQIKHEVYNTDSLPYGSDGKHILCNISTANNGVAFYKGIGTDDSDIYYLHSSSDSIDFSVPRTFRIVSNDGTGYTDYTVKVNIHQEDDVPIKWSAVTTNEALAKLKMVKTFFYSGYFYIFGSDGNNTKVYRSKDGVNYELLNSSTPLSADAWKNVCMVFNTFYMLENNRIYTSFDGATWENFEPLTSKPLKQIIGASFYHIYALSTENTLMMSKDSGDTWEEEYLDDDAQYLPTEDIAIVDYPMTMADNTDYIMMVGNRSTETYNDTTSVIWRKHLDYDDYSNSGFWTFMETDEHEFYIPRNENINLLLYDNSVLAIYGNSKIGDEDHVAYEKILQSRDNGITWKENKYYVMPDIEANAENISAVVDDDNYIWIFCAGGTGQVWRGRLNRVAWNNK